MQSGVVPFVRYASVSGDYPVGGNLLFVLLLINAGQGTTNLVRIPLNFNYQYSVVTSSHM